MTNETRWQLKAILPTHTNMTIELVVDTTAEPVVQAIERAAAEHGIVLERVEDPSNESRRRRSSGVR